MHISIHVESQIRILGLVVKNLTNTWDINLSWRFLFILSTSEKKSCTTLIFQSEVQFEVRPPLSLFSPWCPILCPVKKLKKSTSWLSRKNDWLLCLDASHRYWIPFLLSFTWIAQKNYNGAGFLQLHRCCFFPFTHACLKFEKQTRTNYLFSVDEHKRKTNL